MSARPTVQRYGWLWLYTAVQCQGSTKIQILACPLGNLHFKFYLLEAISNQPKVQSMVKWAMTIFDRACPSGKWPMKSACPTGKSTSPRLSGTVFVEPCNTYLKNSLPALVFSLDFGCPSLSKTLWRTDRYISFSFVKSIPPSESHSGPSGWLSTLIGPLCSASVESSSLSRNVLSNLNLSSPPNDFCNLNSWDENSKG